jgi:hypothetical protein
MDETCSMDDLYMMIYMSKIAQKKWKDTGEEASPPIK